jgi:hypothetical protein
MRSLESDANEKNGPSLVSNRIVQLQGMARGLVTQSSVAEYLTAQVPLAAAIKAPSLSPLERVLLSNV